MPNQRFLLIVENNNVGYLIGYFRNQKKAKKMAHELADKNELHLHDNGVALFENNTNYPTFKIPPSARYSQPKYRTCLTNGVFFAYVVDTHPKEEFSLRKLIYERTNTIYAFDMDDYDPYKKGFVTEDLHFIAN